MKSSPAAYRAQIALGRGARTYVATTSRGSQFEKRAHERMTRRKPHARLHIHHQIQIRSEALHKGEADDAIVG